MLQTFVKSFRLQEAEETLLVINNYNQEFLLKKQERINRVINDTVRVYLDENAQVMFLGKVDQQYHENKENASSRTMYAQNCKEMLYLILES